MTRICTEAEYCQSTTNAAHDLKELSNSNLVGGTLHDCDNLQRQRACDVYWCSMPPARRAVQSSSSRPGLYPSFAYAHRLLLTACAKQRQPRQRRCGNRQAAHKTALMYDLT